MQALHAFIAAGRRFFEAPHMHALHIFLSNIGNAEEAERAHAALRGALPVQHVSVDLHDSDRVLRVVGPAEIGQASMELVQGLGHHCSDSKRYAFFN